MCSVTRRFLSLCLCPLHVLVSDFPPLQDQWQRKKQTKEQKRAAKRAKLDPENRKSAKDVMDENERKRKRELGIQSDEEDAASDVADDQELDQPADDLRQNKKQKIDATKPEKNDAETDDAAKKAVQAEKRREKRQLKKERADKQKLKADAKKAKKQGQESKDTVAAASKSAADDETDEDDDVEIDQSGDVEAMDISGLVDDHNDAQFDDSSAPASPNAISFDTSADQSAASSSSSIVPPASAPTLTAPNGKLETAEPATRAKKPKGLKLPEIDPEELQARLRARIEELRARRKADGPSGQPARSRQDLLDARRKKEEARKQHKKELRLKAKQEEERLNNERLRGSGSPLSTDIFSPRPIDENNFSFGRVAFEDGEADASLSTITDHRKKKGPQDTKTALIAAEKKAARLAGLDEDKRADIAEKDLWLNAKKRAHGERVRDDQSLLKKALKRKEQTKAKSSREWNDRIESVKYGKEKKQKKREENLAKRKEDKGSKKSKGAKKGGAKKGRPGFEGKFKG